MKIVLLLKSEDRKDLWVFSDVNLDTVIGANICEERTLVTANISQSSQVSKHASNVSIKSSDINVTYVKTLHHVRNWMKQSNEVETKSANHVTNAYSRFVESGL